MSLIVACPTCKTQLSVAETMVGQQVRCPNCSTVLQIGAAPPAPPPPVIPKPPVLPPPVSAHVPPSPPIMPPPAPVMPPPVGRTPPLPPAAGRPAPAARPSRRAEDYEPSGGSGMSVVLAVVLLLVGLGAGGAGAYFGLRNYFKPAEPSGTEKPVSTATPAVSDLTYLPNDCQFIASVSVPACLSSDTYKKLEKAGVGLDDNVLGSIFGGTELGLKDIDRVVIAGNLTEGVMIVRTVKPVRVADLKIPQDMKSTSVGKHTVYQSAVAALYLPDDRTLVLSSSPKTVESIVKRNEPTKLTGGLKAVYVQANPTWAFWAAIDLSLLPEKLPLPGGVNFDQQLPQLKKNVEAVVIESPADRPLDFQIIVRCKDEKSSAAVKEVLTQTSEKPRQSLGEAVQVSPLEAVNNRVVVRVTVSAAILYKLMLAAKQESPDFCVNQLGDEDPARRQEATDRLKRMAERAAPALGRGLAKTDLNRQTAILMILDEMGERGAGAAGAVAALVRDPQADLRLAAIRTLGKFGAVAKRDALAALLHARKDSDDRVRLAAQQVLEKLGPLKADEAAKIAADTTLDPRARVNAMLALATIEGEAPNITPALLDALKDKNKELRAAAAMALGKTGAKQHDVVFPALVAALKDAETEVQTAALFSLDTFGAPNEKEVSLLLETFKEESTPPAVRTATAKLLGKAGPLAGKEGFNALLGGLEHNDPAVRGACLAALEGLPVPGGDQIPTLVGKLGAPRATVEMKRFALGTLNKLGDKVDRAKVPDLGSVLVGLIDTNPELVEKAFETLIALGPPAEADAPLLLRLLKSKNAGGKVRGYATRALAPLAAKSADVATALIEMLGDMEVDIRRMSAEGLAKAGLKTPEAIAAFAKALDDKDVAVRQQIVAALIALPDENRQYAFLLKAYQDDNDEIVHLAAAGLAKMDKLTKEELDALARSLTEGKPRVRVFALSVLVEQKDAMAEVIVPALVKLARDDSPKVRLMAVKALQTTGGAPETVVPILVGALNDVHPPVCVAAATGLIKLKQEPKKVVETLLKTASDKATLASGPALEALGQLGDWAKPALPALMKALEMEGTRDAAKAGLIGMGREAVNELKNALERSKNPATQILLLETLGRIGAPARTALLPVLNLMKSTNAEVKEAAKKASDAIQKSKP